MKVVNLASEFSRRVIRFFNSLIHYSKDELEMRGEMNKRNEPIEPKVKYLFGPDIDLEKEVVLDKRGRRLTEARAQQIARQILREVAAGLTSLTGAKIISPEVKARVPQGLKDKLDREAKKLGVTPSVLIRQALEEYLYD
jgi:hypothetical protein